MGVAEIAYLALLAAGLVIGGAVLSAPVSFDRKVSSLAATLGVVQLSLSMLAGASSGLWREFFFWAAGVGTGCMLALLVYFLNRRRILSRGHE